MRPSKSNASSGIDIRAACELCLDYTTCAEIPHGDKPSVRLKDAVEVQIRNSDDEHYDLSIGYCGRVGKVVLHDLSTLPPGRGDSHTYGKQSLKELGSMPGVEVDLRLLEPIPDTEV